MPAESLAASAIGDDLAEELSWLKLDEVTQAVDLAEIEHAYQALELEEARVEVEISECIEGSAKVEAHLAQLFALQENVAAMATQLVPMQSVIDATAANAGAISGSVRFLDQERLKLERALETVKETSLLKTRLAELLTAMDARDIDAAATLVHEYATTGSETLDSPFVCFAAPAHASNAAAGLESPRETIAAATKELVERVSYMFDAAVESNNTREIGRCFRLFPLLGEEQRGLDRYSEFLCSAIADKSRLTGEVRGSVYALRITRLFEAIAAVIDNHFSLVEQHYGAGRMVRVIQRLQMEGARRACMVLDFFEEERHIKRRLSQIQLADASAIKARAQPRSVEREDAISDADFKDITSILVEIVLIERQIATFGRFLESRAAPEARSLLEDPEARDRVFLAPEALAKLAPISSQSTFDANASYNRSSGGVFDENTGLIAHTPLSARLEWLTDTYVTLETFFVSRSVAKAMALDDADSLTGWNDVISSDADSANRKGQLSGPSATGAGRHSKVQGSGFSQTAQGIQQTSSCVGDMFFVVKTALEHAISIQQPAAIEAVTQCVISSMNSEFLAAMQSRALEKWATAAASSRSALGSTASSESGWRLPGVGSPGGSAEHTAVPVQLSPQAQSQRRVLVALNNLDLACTYLQKTVDGLRANASAEWARASRNDDAARAKTAIDTLAAFSAKFTHVKQRSLEQIGVHVLKPWMRAILQHSYCDIKYVLTDEEFNDMQSDNLFQQRFMLKFRGLAQQLSPRLTPGNFAAALDLAISSLAQDWERAIRQSKFNMLGGIMFEKDVREIQRYLEQESGSLLRPRFARLVQMADVLAVESAADVRHILDAQPVDMSARGALSEKDIQGLLANRIDLAAGSDGPKGTTG
ncbi:Golgi transport complex subunit 4 [Coemansia sp. RSA 2711]|nr:Golgi transport complex subunit 4 [Coemansia sp. RSA 2711]